ncbi:hypothetical protein AK812_SmicGene33567 [Symbiodinium microadriaticum]|uniref:Uncharacterized protein n=1 Tax=Symbiodinium microadriaticum TaxID=2951 RepID=A0A1Q9CRB4_SYMMI|nr:hypothetical protein AK812_SmicGene33567 [Symbiodinium microadriaticum]
MAHWTPVLRLSFERPSYRFAIGFLIVATMFLVLVALNKDRWSLLTRIYDSPRRMVERAGPAETFLIPGALLLILLIAWRTKNPVLETRFRVEKRKDTAIHRWASSLQYLPLLVCCKFMSFE